MPSSRAPVSEKVNPPSVTAAPAVTSSPSSRTRAEATSMPEPSSSKTAEMTGEPSTFVSGAGLGSTSAGGLVSLSTTGVVCAIRRSRIDILRSSSASY